MAARPMSFFSSHACSQFIVLRLYWVSYGDSCAADREILESECGERGYVIDEDTCEGSCINCPDSDDDGVGDACDFCPDNPDYGRKEIKKYVVPALTICGTYLYAGESCGHSIVQCDRSEEYHPISPQVIDAHEMARCCRAKVEEEECVVDENCEANKDEGVCKCPDGSTNCDACENGKCTCPDLDGDGSSDSPCDECQLPDCTCPDTDFDGEPNSPCDACQDHDGDGEPDGDPGPQPPPSDPKDPNDQDGDKIPDNEDPCPTNPNPNCQPGDEDGDKIPDDKDPCPKNPDPNCTSTCLTTLDKFKAWTMTAESFPFNWMRAVSEMFGPLTSLTPALPDSIGMMEVELSVTEYGQSATLDFGSGYKVIRDSIVVARLSLAIKVLRWAMGITILMYMLPYFAARWSNIHGVSR